jgi:hypothetical protein
VYRATVLRDAGRFDRALEDYRAAVTANPSNAEAKLAVRRAEARSDPSGLRKSSTRVPTLHAKSARNQWILLAALVIATVALLVVYVRLRG